jgi:signal peptidase I
VAVAVWMLAGSAWAECVRQGFLVRTSQMHPLVRKGEFIHVYAGQCDFPVERGAVVMVTTRSPFPQVRVVRALPGDTLTVESRGGSRVLLVNGTELRNSVGKPYRFSALSAEVMREHLSPFGGRLPEGAYLVLGDRPDFTLDAQQLAPVLRRDILGVMMDPGKPARAGTDAGVPTP